MRLPLPFFCLFLWIHVVLNDLLDLSLVDPEGGLFYAAGRGLMDVLQIEAVDRYRIRKFEKRCERLLLLVAVDVANGHTAADRSFLKEKEGGFFKVLIPIGATVLAKRCVALGGADVFDNDIVKPSVAGAIVVVAHDQRVVAVISIYAVNVDVAQSVALTCQEADGRVAIACRQIADHHVFNITQGDFGVGLVVGGQRYQIVVGGAA